MAVGWLVEATSLPSVCRSRTVAMWRNGPLWAHLKRRAGLSAYSISSRARKRRRGFRLAAKSGGALSWEQDDDDITAMKAEPGSSARGWEGKRGSNLGEARAVYPRKQGVYTVARGPLGPLRLHVVGQADYQPLPVELRYPLLDSPFHLVETWHLVQRSFLSALPPDPSHLLWTLLFSALLSSPSSPTPPPSEADLLRSCRQRAVWILPAWETPRLLGLKEGTRIAHLALKGGRRAARVSRFEETGSGSPCVHPTSYTHTRKEEGKLPRHGAQIHRYG